MAYIDFLENITAKVDSLVNEISAEYNFDLGPEFEIVFCRVLRFLLPSKYGICRGFIVSKDGQIAGDDIIIYDQERFPTLRLLENNRFDQKQKIPVEAVYAYIEAKHTLCIEGDGGQSLSKAMNQAAAVKRLPRERVPFNQVTPQMSINGLSIKRADGWPSCHNPLYTAIISRHVRLKEKGGVSEVDSFLPHLKLYCGETAYHANNPDLIIAGANAVVLPAVKNSFKSPFSIEALTHLEAIKSDGQAFAVGLLSMMYAFDSIVLGTIHWPTILASGLGIPLTDGGVDTYANPIN
ncbi:DUF6602 domain-containing protein [uncultured Hymenobacter sp.]|uniref:DUF6602 domain-containing protein n=1 Tax=uncultured Hymenobacter sp. TaxID=170016 RepID=UPI0035C9BDA3